MTFMTLKFLVNKFYYDNNLNAIMWELMQVNFK